MGGVSPAGAPPTVQPPPNTHSHARLAPNSGFQQGVHAVRPPAAAHLFLQRAGRQQAVHEAGLGLAVAPDACHRLLVHGRLPARMGKERGAGESASCPARQQDGTPVEQRATHKAVRVAPRPTCLSARPPARAVPLAQRTFQSLSTRTRWLAPTRLSPAPPARVDSRNTRPWLNLLKRSTTPWRSSTEVLPSMRTDSQLQGGGGRHVLGAWSELPVA